MIAFYRFFSDLHVRVFLQSGVGILLATAISLVQAATVTFTASGTWVAPAGVTSATVEAWGGGGGGGGATGNPAKGGGGAGGQYAKKVVTVTPGTSYAIAVGAGGSGTTAAGGPGGDSTFATTTVVAKGGFGGGLASANNSGGSAGSGSLVGGVGDVVYKGGNGSAGVASGSGGAGGGGAGSTGNGGDASGNTAGVGATSGGGAGAAGLAAGSSSNCSNSATVAGGGGCGGSAGSSTNRSGGAGAAGQVLITYAAPPIVTTNTASALTTVGATLNGTATSNDAQTTVTFEYGLTTAYGTTVTATPSPIAAGVTPTGVSAAISGLTCGTLYHFRVVGASAIGTANGNDVSFSTSACPAVASINTISTNPNTTNSAVSWTVLFNTSVTGVDVSDFALVQGGGASGASITSVTGSGATWTVVVNSGTTYGTLGLNLVDNDTIVNNANVPLGGAGNGSFTGQVYTIVAPVPILAKTASSTAAVVNDVMTFTITATNPYGSDMSSVTVSDVLPTGMTYSAHAVTLGSVAVSGQTLTWTIPLIPAGGSAQLTLAVTVTQSGVLVNTVSSPGATSASASVLVVAGAVTHFRFDETAGSWAGTTGEVIDSGTTGLHGKRLTTTSPTTTNAVTPSPTIASQYPSVSGSFCNAAQFDGNGVMEVADSPLFDYTTTLSASAWIYPTAYPTSDLYSILSNDVNYEFHLNTAGKLYWWWNSATLTSAATIPLNQWTHIAITFNSTAGRQRIYINGVQDTNTNNWTGTLQQNLCKFYVGGDVATGSCALIPGRNFRGKIDEVKLYNTELSAAEVQANMTLGRSCSGAYDHIRIEHDASASICTPETVTIKACLNAGCSTLYPGAVTVAMSSTGWVGGDTFTFSGGVVSKQVSRGTAGTLVLGTNSTSPIATNGTRCFSGSTETCNLTFVAASCSFDAVETGAAAQTRLFTKLAGAPFSVDVLALSSGTTINTSYTGNVTVDLVDASTSSCPTGAGLGGTSQSIAYVLANSGRKPVNFTYAQANPNVRVRMVAGTSAPACSTDAFAIRPQSLTVNATKSDGTTPLIASTNGAAGATTVAAGTVFTMYADSTTTGYGGTPKLGTALMSDFLSGTTPGPLSFTAPPFSAANAAGKASGTTFKYDEVGYFSLTADAVYDDDWVKNGGSGDWAGGDCVTASASNVKVSGKYGCNIGSAATSWGRFKPDHFDTVVTPAGGTFTYSGQPFTVQVTARSASGTQTANYAGAYAESVTLSDANSASNNSTTLGGFSNATIAVASFTTAAAGQVTANNVTYTFTNKETAPLETRTGSNPLKIRATSTAVSSSTGTEGTTDIRSGRLQIFNAIGSEKSPLQMQIQSQYWGGSSWVLNSLDNSTSLPANAFFLSNYLDGKGVSTAAWTTSVSGAVTLSGGKANLTLAAPTGGNTGSVSVAINLGSSGSDQSCLTTHGGTAAGMPWLRARNGNCAATFDRDPSGRATFGIYSPETRRTVHIRELY